MAANNVPKIIIAHDYIRVSFGNNRGLSASYGAEKSSGSVPGNVFDLWSKSHRSDESALTRIGLKKGANHQEITEAFVKHIDTIWPEWNVGPKVPAVGDTVTVNFGKRKGVDTGVVQKVKGTQVSILFKREGLVRMAADMLVDDSQ